MPNQRSLIIGVVMGLLAVVALSLFVINSFNPLKISLPTSSIFNFPPTKLETTLQASPSGDDWTMPQTSVSAQPLFLVIINPSNNLVTAQQQIKLNGQTAVGAKLSLNEQALTTNPDGSFSAIMSLQPGENEIIVAARNDKNEENIQTALVLAAPEAEGKTLEVKSLIGVVSAITGNNYQLTTDKGFQTEFEVNPLTRYLRLYGGQISKESVLTGHAVEVVGVGTEALLIRDLSLKEHKLWK